MELEGLKTYLFFAGSVVIATVLISFYSIIWNHPLVSACWNLSVSCFNVGFLTASLAYSRVFIKATWMILLLMVLNIVMCIQGIISFIN